jgi:hypothetical protein
VSGQATGWVLRHGPKNRAMRAVLIPIADAANRDGEHAHPGLEAIIEGSLYKRAHVLAILKQLQEEGWVEIEERASPGRATSYRLPRMARVQESDPKDSDPEPVTGPESNGHGSKNQGPRVQSETDPSFCSSSTTVYPTVVPNVAPLRSARRDADWDALVLVCEVAEPIPKSARGAYNRALKEIREAGGTAEEIERRGLNFRLRWPDASLTPTALARRWSECASVPRKLSKSAAALASHELGLI